MRLRSPTLAVACLVLAGCGGGASKAPRAGNSSRSTTCASVTAHLVTFGDALENASVDAKARGATYAGRLELLLSFER